MMKDVTMRAIVTGGASGIGRATAHELATDYGFSVVVADLNRTNGEEAVAAIRRDGGTAEFHELDVTSQAAVTGCQADLESRELLPSVIINAAGWNVGQPFLENESDFIDKVVSLNFRGVMNVCQTFLRPLVEAGQPGSVVNVSSDAGRVGSLGETVYAGAKGGVIAFTKSLAREMARHQINCNVVCPGPTDTPLFKLQPEKIQAALIRAIPMRRLGAPEEVAAVVSFLSSPPAQYVTGQVISVNGGLTMVG